MLQKTAFFHLRNIAKPWNMLPVYNAEKLVHPFMISRLDYCNAVLGGCLGSSINKLQIVRNAGQENMIILPEFYSLCTGYLLSSVLVTKYILSKALNGLAPAYLTNLLSCYNPTRSLRSQNSGILVVPRTAKSTKGGMLFHIWLPNSGIAFLIMFRVQTHSLCLNLD